MEAFNLIPVFIMFIMYLAVLGFIVWFAITLINVQKERNSILKDMSNKLDIIGKRKEEE